MPLLVFLTRDGGAARDAADGAMADGGESRGGLSACQHGLAARRALHGTVL
ncbi:MULTISPECIES: hypothetical protein [Streptomyces]|uniref:hypothetical protein n=1 Tax=Streptomyces TaxID=1883 RepID=UPI001CC06021|nr:hypothetical protein [Streptomyces sp. A144]UAX58415.1 hypothetical protein K5X85_35370 [Streptomyces sp. A144]